MAAKAKEGSKGTAASTTGKRKGTAARSQTARGRSAAPAAAQKAVRRTAAGGAAAQKKKRAEDLMETRYLDPEQEKEREKARMVRREIALWAILAVCVLMVISNFGFGGTIGEQVSQILFGVFGVLAYLIPVLLFLLSAFLLSNGGKQRAVIKAWAGVIGAVAVCSLLELIFHGYTKGAMLIDYYEMSSTLHSGGGIAGGLLCVLLCPTIGVAGTYVVIFVLLIISAVLLTERSLFAGMGRQSRKVMESAKQDRERRREAAAQREAQHRQQLELEKQKIKEQQGALEDKLKAGWDALDLKRDIPAQEKAEKPSEIQVPLLDGVQAADSRRDHRAAGVSQNTKLAETEEKKPAPQFSFTIQRNGQTEEVQAGSVDEVNVSSFHQLDMELSGGEKPANIPETEEAPAVQTLEKTEKPRAARKTKAAKEAVKAEAEAVASAIEADAEKPKQEYVFPPLSLLKLPDRKKSGNTDEQLKETAMKLQQTLHTFGVNVTVTNVSCGPSVTRYELLPEMGVKVSRIVNLADDIKLNLAAADIRIEAPIPGKAAVGIEVPNAQNSTVMLRELLESREFQSHPSGLAFATGKDIAGQVVVSDIAKMPHLLIAGSTGSGKSVCINTLIMSILYKSRPDEVKLIMIDPKVVELSVYNGIPHLMIPVVTDPKKAAGALNWAVAEMMDRYKKFETYHVRDMKGFNAKVESIADIEEEGKPEKLPQIVIIVDELADLMMVAKGEVEDAICRLAQLARAAGIHLIIATQRPSVDVITGLIKANMPSRIAFAVSSGVDSRTILDMYGAEKLLGKGDMLFYPQGYAKPARVQGAFVSDSEVGAVVEFLKENGQEQAYNPDIEEKIQKAAAAAAVQGGTDSGDGRDELFVKAGKFIIEKDKASIGMLQRVFKIGFNRAARIMDQLSDAGVVGPEEGTKPRKILMSESEFDAYVDEYV